MFGRGNVWIFVGVVLAGGRRRACGGLPRRVLAALHRAGGPGGPGPPRLRVREAGWLAGPWKVISCIWLSPQEKGVEDWNGGQDPAEASTLGTVQLAGQ